MYLKKIYIQGFKSFADKTEIKFNNDITAIIGPNGSGKSNISDAIRWVLGEQSIKNLRGSKMEDVIFTGTDKRRALGFAEVSIVFDNSDQQIPLDYNEVSITRRMFRSGESEFYINKNQCRLKDVRELLMDTGLGKEGYSIVGQGKIDEILSTKPVDRRGIFEEAAGIVKFKNKKLEAERKLDKTQYNISRIEDLIYEVENQKNQIEKEANKTEKFNRLFIKLKELEVNQFIKDINKLEMELKKLKVDQINIKEQAESLTQDKIRIESKYSTLKREIKSKEEAIEESRNVKIAAIQDFEKNKNQLVLLEEKRKHLTNEIMRLQDYNIKIKDKLKELEVNRDKTKDELAKTKVSIEQAILESKKKETNLSIIREKIISIEAEQESKKDEIIFLYNNISDKKSEKNSSINFMDTIKSRLSEINNDIKEINLHKGELTKKLENLAFEKETLNLNLSENNKKLQAINISYERLYGDYEKLNENINNSKIRLNGLNSNFNLINNMENDYDGYYNSVKRFLKAIDRDKKLKEGFEGVVADLIQVEDTYVKAIEVSLGGSAQNIVIDDERYAKGMIDYLKNNKIGRVTFLPKNTIKGFTISINDNLRKNYNILGLASELVNYDNSNVNIINYLLGRIIVIKDMNSAIRYSKSSNYKHKVVTLEGEVFNPGGSISGGSLGDSRISILSRKNKLKNLGQEIEDEERNLNNLITSKEILLDKLNKYKGTRGSLEENIEKSKIDFSNVKNLIESNESHIIRFNQDLERKHKEANTLESEYDNLLLNQDNFSNTIKKLELKEISLKEEIQGINLTLKDEKERLASLDKEQTELTININSIQNDERNLSKRLIEIKNEKEILTSSIDKNIEEIDSIEKEILSIDNQKEDLEEYQKNHDEKEDTLSKQLTELIESKDKLMQTFYEEQDNLKIINDRLSNLEKNLNSINVKIARYEVEKENISSRLLEEYELDYEQAMIYQKDFKEDKNSKYIIKDLKEEIKGLGNVNINALEEFKNIKERYEFMDKQYQDLIDAREDLKLVIKDMDKQMKSQFIKKFEVINSNFRKVFSILFDGGFAKLELEDEKNILESGIDIVVQPPGKKLQYLNLLSGGEKSLTAVALLFSILMTKPSPFCILDEIDAALDESNINRYIKYLKNFNDSTQFILITHRKTTMEIADVLYGVTMEEQGVSKLISIKLKDEIVAS